MNDSIIDVWAHFRHNMHVTWWSVPIITLSSPLFSSRGICPIRMTKFFHAFISHTNIDVRITYGDVQYACLSWLKHWIVLTSFSPACSNVSWSSFQNTYNLTVYWTEDSWGKLDKGLSLWSNFYFNVINHQ